VIDIEGLIATTSVWKKTSIAPEAIKEVVEAYAKVKASLDKHEPGFPDAKVLMGLIKRGIAKYGMEGVGDANDSEGSELIIKALEKNDNRPLWVTAWGGVNTLAQALYKLEKTRSPAEFKRLLARLRVYTISDQDDSGNWLRTKYPGLFFIVTPGDNYASSTWVAITASQPGANNTVVSNQWIAENIQNNHGPLGATYPDVAFGMEGDTPSFLSLIPNGLNDPEHPDWGGWGGRYELYLPEFSTIRWGTSGVPQVPETRPVWTNASDSLNPYEPGEFGRVVKPGKAGYNNNKVTLWRWREDFQNDFAARMDWTIKLYKDANHPPVIKLNHSNVITVKAGGTFHLNAKGTKDPDGDHLSFLWFNYPEAGSYKNPIKTSSAENIPVVRIVAPTVDKKETVHFILKVTDHGTPQLTRYERVIVNIEP
jgi:hypothetical protein